MKLYREPAMKARRTRRGWDQHHLDMLGAVHDRDVADAKGCTVQAVYQARKAMGIKAYHFGGTGPGIPEGELGRMLGRVRRLADWGEPGVNRTSLAEHAGVGRALVAKWLRGDRAPRDAEVKEIASWLMSHSEVETKIEASSDGRVALPLTQPRIATALPAPDKPDDEEELLDLSDVPEPDLAPDPEPTSRPGPADDTDVWLSDARDARGTGKAPDGLSATQRLKLDLYGKTSGPGGQRLYNRAMRVLIPGGSETLDLLERVRGLALRANLPHGWQEGDHHLGHIHRGVAGIIDAMEGAVAKRYGAIPPSSRGQRKTRRRKQKQAPAS